MLSRPPLLKLAQSASDSRLRPRGRWQRSSSHTSDPLASKSNKKGKFRHDNLVIFALHSLAQKTWIYRKATGIVKNDTFVKSVSFEMSSSFTLYVDSPSSAIMALLLTAVFLMINFITELGSSPKAPFFNFTLSNFTSVSRWACRIPLHAEADNEQWWRCRTFSLDGNANSSTASWMTKTLKFPRQSITCWHGVIRWPSTKTHQLWQSNVSEKTSNKSAVFLNKIFKKMVRVKIIQKDERIVAAVQFEIKLYVFFYRAATVKIWWS